MSMVSCLMVGVVVLDLKDRLLMLPLAVDSAAWRTSGGAPGHTVSYPDFLLSEEEVGVSRRSDDSKR